MNLLLSPLVKGIEILVKFRNILFDKKYIAIHTVPVPVVSIGNITVGGTGKTPVTQYCLEFLKSDQKKVAVVSRSYLADANAPIEVDRKQPSAAKYFGDEPLLIAQKNPEVSVFVGPKKWKTAKYALTQDKFDLVIVDDGFQHRKLHRDLDVIILDATEDFKNYQLFPFGRAREPWAHLSRADLFIISKCNLTTEEKVGELQKRLPPGKEVLLFGYAIEEISQFTSDTVLNLEAIRGKNFLLVSAIAKPEIFERMVAQFGTVAPESLRFRDHHHYTTEDITNIFAAFKKSNADYILTTEKDRVKLASVIGDSKAFWSAQLILKEMSQKGRLNEIFRQLYR